MSEFVHVLAVFTVGAGFIAMVLGAIVVLGLLWWGVIESMEKLFLRSARFRRVAKFVKETDEQRRRELVDQLRGEIHD